VEDGDPKGYQSSKGINEKQVQKIKSWMLSPHTPGWMPLDCSLWAAIESRTFNKRKNENEPMASYKKRLSIAAKRLPKDLIVGCLRQMKGNIAKTLANEGGHAQRD